MSMHEIQALIQIHPNAAKDKIVKALRAHGMHLGNTAAALGCSYNTFLRWVEQLKLAPTIDRMKAQAKKEGWRHTQNTPSTGRPPGAKDKTPRTRRRPVDAAPR
jgi:transposase